MFKTTLSVLMFATAVAGAQTVTVGSTTSTTNGATTTITVPVSVAVPPASGSTGGPMASLRVEAGGGLGQAITQTVSSYDGFKTIVLPHVVVDTASGWNPSSNSYTVPVTGTYLIISNVRLVDFLRSGISYGQGADTNTADSYSFLWTTTAGLRNGFGNSRVMQLTAGQKVSLFAYIDSQTPINLSSAILNIQQLP